MKTFKNRPLAAIYQGCLGLISIIKPWLQHPRCHGALRVLYLVWKNKQTKNAKKISSWSASHILHWVLPTDWWHPKHLSFCCNCFPLSAVSLPVPPGCAFLPSASPAATSAWGAGPQRSQAGSLGTKGTAAQHARFCWKFCTLSSSARDWKPTLFLAELSLSSFSVSL